jgi:hypothetical protein
MDANFLHKNGVAKLAAPATAQKKRAKSSGFGIFRVKSTLHEFRSTAHAGVWLLESQEV